MSEGGSAVLAIHGALVSSLRFVYDNSLALVGLSLAWVVASIPLVTVGPATVGAYAAIHSLKEKGWIDRRDVFAVVRRQAIHALLLGVVAAIIAVMGLLYALQFFANGSTLAAVLGALAIYVAAHLALVLPATLLGLSRDVPVRDALWVGYRWTVRRPLTAVMMGAMSLLLFLVSVLMTVAVIIIFPAVLFSFHDALLDGVATSSGDSTTDVRSRTG